MKELEKEIKNLLEKKKFIESKLNKLNNLYQPSIKELSNNLLNYIDHEIYKPDTNGKRIYIKPKLIITIKEGYYLDTDQKELIRIHMKELTESNNISEIIYKENI